MMERGSEKRRRLPRATPRRYPRGKSERDPQAEENKGVKGRVDIWTG